MDHESNKIYNHLSEIGRICKPIVASKYLLHPSNSSTECLNTKCSILCPCLLHIVSCITCIVYLSHLSFSQILTKNQLQVTSSNRAEISTIHKLLSLRIDISFENLWLEDEILLPCHWAISWYFL